MIEIKKTDYFDPRSIFECGQVFRYLTEEDGNYRIFTGDKTALIRKSAEGYIIDCADDAYFRRYLDLDTDYEKIIRRLSQHVLLAKAAQFGKGIRILRQEPFETLIGFIVSANNHIPRIKGILQRLSNALGEKRNYKGYEYRAFPTARAMAEKNTDYYESQGLGYRAKYIAQTAKAVYGGWDLDGLCSLSTEEARKELLSLSGVGPKVADCILLFAYAKTDTFPVDTWIEKVYYDYFDGKTLPAKKISHYFIERFGNLAGYAQQYLFYYKRELD